MCRFVEIMENFQGDLTDIVRGTALTDDVSSSPSPPPPPQTAAAPWRFPSTDPINFTTNSVVVDDPCTAVVDASFGDPFSAMSDPLLHHLHLHPPPLHHQPSSFFIAPPAPVLEDGGGFTTTSNTCSTINNKNESMSVLGGHYKIFEDDMMSSSNSTTNYPPCATLSRIQISKAQMGCDSSMVSPRGGGLKKGVDVMINASCSSKGAGCLTDGAGQVQISSPRNLGIKRRKNQAKKVVCIPAPAAANSRSTGEVVPSDLWAWRKYGQKPIKGSPYPRGYYRCSSSKGCSARKQVERSRTDPNMLVITYTSEHNHPWPTQRNALAGSTRSQPASTTTCTASSKPTKNNNNNSNIKPAADHQSCSSSGDATIAPPDLSPSIKEESLADDDNDNDDDDDDDQNYNNKAHDETTLTMQDDEMGGGEFYRPEMMSSAEDEYCHHHNHEDLFAGLDEIIDSDPLNLLFSCGDDGEEHDHKISRDPFSIFDWSAGEIKRRSLSP